MSNTAPVPIDKAKNAKRRGLLPIVAALVVLAGGGGAAYWTFAGKGAAPAGAAAEAEPEPAHAEPPPGAPIPLETFIVNLSGSGSHFLRVTLSLIVENETIAAEIGENEVIKMRVRSALLELLAQQTADSLVTPEGKAALKTAIAEAAHHAFAGLHVTDVLFSEFVVQF